MGAGFAKLFESDQQLVEVTRAFEAMVSKSLETHPMRSLTRTEVKRRFNMCAEIFARLRGDLRWGLARTLDRMPEYLQAELNGLTWVPDERACWTPKDGEIS